MIQPIHKRVWNSAYSMARCQNCKSYLIEVDNSFIQFIKFGFITPICLLGLLLRYNSYSIYHWWINSYDYTPTHCLDDFLIIFESKYLELPPNSIHVETPWKNEKYKIFTDSSAFFLYTYPLGHKAKLSHSFCVFSYQSHVQLSTERTIAFGCECPTLRHLMMKK